MVDPFRGLWNLKLEDTLLFADHTCIIEFGELLIDFHDLFFCCFDFFQILLLKNI